MSGLTPYLMLTTIDSTGRHEIPGLMIAIVTVCVTPAFLRMNETRSAKPGGASRQGAEQ